MPFLRAFRPALLTSLLVAGACAPASRDDAVAAGATDDFGVAVPRKLAARRVVSLGPSTTELLFALGAGDRVVGRSRWDGWPTAARQVPEVGDAIRPSVERVVAARPDLVVLYAATDNRTAADAMRGLGIPVLALRIDRIEDYLRALDVLGRLTHTTARADTLRHGLLRQLDSVRAATRGLTRPSVFVRVFGDPLMTVGRTSFLSELIAIAGGENVYGDREESAFTVAVEDVVARDPEVIAAGPEGLTMLRARPEWRGTRAVRTGRLITFDTSLTSQPTMRLGDAAWAIARLLHPTLARP